MSVISELNDEVAKLQTQLNMLTARRDALQATLDYVNTQRPAGIPTTWNANFSGRLPNPVTIFAWFDPAKFGEDLQRR